MQFTNKADLPKPVENFLKFSDYNASGVKFDISATRLIDSPNIAKLWSEHGKEVSEDVSDRLWSAVGSGIHKRFEDANSWDPDVIMEKRFVSEINGKLVSAQIDALHVSEKTLLDLKTTSAWKVVNKDYDKYEKQMNIQAHLAGLHGYEVEKIQVVIICRDWSKARSGELNYPNTPIQIVDLDLWTKKEQALYIRERLELHFGDGEKTCTDEDRWARPESFAVKVKGKKRALRVLPTMESALLYAADNNLADSKYSIEERPATYTRCESYCAVSKWCSQFNATK
jgi:hypothetical protein